jgi:hypothetical protein
VRPPRLFGLSVKRPIASRRELALAFGGAIDDYSGLGATVTESLVEIVDSPQAQSLLAGHEGRLLAEN